MQRLQVCQPCTLYPAPTPPLLYDDSPSDCSKFNLGSQKDWYRSGSWSSLNFILPPKHSVTLNPSSASSPVNSRLTPPKRESHSVWMRMADVSSLMIVPKFRVFNPVEDVRVLCSHLAEQPQSVDIRGDDTYFPCIGSEIQMTGWPDSLTALMWPGRHSSTFPAP